MTTPLSGIVVVTTPGAPAVQVGGSGNVTVTPALQGPAGPQGPQGPAGSGATTFDALTDVTTVGKAVAKAADAAAARTALGAPSTTDVAGKQPNVAWSATQSANFTAAVNTGYPVNTASGTIAVTLPTSVANQQIVIKKLSSDVNTVTVSGTINGTPSATVTLRLGLESKVFIGDGTGWNVYAGDLSVTALDGRFLKQADASATYATTAQGAKADAALPAATAASTYAPVWQAGEVLTTGARRTLPIARVGVLKASGTARSSFDATEQALWSYPRLTFTGTTTGAPSADIPGATVGDVYVDSAGAEYMIASS